MKRQDFHYTLPPELIATHPAERRERSRLLHVPPEGAFGHHHFSDITNLLRPGDCLVLNDSRVIPARLHARRPTGGECEVLLIEPEGPDQWRAMVRPARKLAPGQTLALTDDVGHVEILASHDERTRSIRLVSDLPLERLLETCGELPLPPYILKQRKARREPRSAPEDRRRYQTVYAREPGSVAAPTAGLHFTESLLDELTAQGVEVRRVTLHVGPGTFEPLTVDDPAAHPMHAERYVIEPEAAEAIDRARRDPARRIVAVGTTSVRTLEACCAAHGAIVPCADSTDLFIRPGFRFGVVGAMITNFHLPESTLLMLVAAFVGRERILAAYHEAIAQQYHFFSYGDAMLLEPPGAIAS